VTLPDSEILDRMAIAVEKVRARLERAAAALDSAGVPYAVAGGNAVAAWVARVDEAAVRNTQDVDLLLRRQELDSAAAALAPAGFVRRHVKGIERFLDGPAAKAREAVHVVIAREKVRPDDDEPAPDVDESEPIGPLRVLTLAALVQMKLTSFRLKDQVHLIDLLDVGLIDAGWADRLPESLRDRLRLVIATADRERLG